MTIEHTIKPDDVGVGILSLFEEVTFEPKFSQEKIYGKRFFFFFRQILKP